MKTIWGLALGVAVLAAALGVVMAMSTPALEDAELSEWWAYAAGGSDGDA